MKKRAALCCAFMLLLSIMLLAFAGAGYAGAATLSATPATVLPGETITITYAGSLGDYKDWIGLYEKDEPDNYRYLSSNDDLYSQSGTVTFQAPMTTGTYQFRMINYDNNTVAATCTVTVSLGSATLTPSASVVKPGESIGVTYTGSLGNYKDWIGLYEKGEPDSYRYLSSNDNLYNKSGTVTFTAPSTIGVYEFRMINYANNAMVAACSFEVKLEGTVTATPSTVKPGEVINVAYTGAMGSYGDWIGLYKVGEQDKYNYVESKECYLKNGTLQFNAPQQLGVYEFRMYNYANGVQVAASDHVSVKLGNEKVTATPSQVGHEEDIKVAYSGAPGNYNDWIGFFEVGEYGVGNAIDSQFLKGKKSGTLTFTAPDFDGQFEFRLYDANNNLLADSNVVAVKEIAGNGYLSIDSWTPAGIDEDGTAPVSTKQIKVVFDNKIAKGKDIKKIKVTCEFDGKEYALKTSPTVKNDTLTIKLTKPSKVSGWPKTALMKDVDFTLFIPRLAVTDAKTKKLSMDDDVEIVFTAE